MNRDLATRLADELQAMFFENVAMRRYLDELRRINDGLRTNDSQLSVIPDSRSLIEAMRVSPEMRDLGKDAFLCVRSQIEDAQTLDQVIEQILLTVQQRQELKEL